MTSAASAWSRAQCALLVAAADAPPARLAGVAVAPTRLVVLPGTALRVPMRPAEEIARVAAMLPGGVDVVGVSCGLEGGAAETMGKALDALGTWAAPLGLGVVAVGVVEGDNVRVRVRRRSVDVDVAAFTPDDVFASASHVLLRLRAELQATWDAAGGTAEVERVIESLERAIRRGTVLVHDITIFSSTSGDTTTVEALRNGTAVVQPDRESRSGQRGKKAAPPQAPPAPAKVGVSPGVFVECQLMAFEDVGAASLESLQLNVAPVRFTDRCTSVVLLDVVAACEPSMSLEACAERLVQAAARQLRHVVPETMKASLPLVPHHFRPLGVWPFSVTAYYPIDAAHADDVNELYLEGRRRELHQRLLLPETRPLFRTTQALGAVGRARPERATARLRDVHLSVPPADLSGGRAYVVEGSYEYYHYMQDNFNDSGWGCSYRSFQTLCSWVLHENFGTRAVPSHTEIQQALVDLGDKDKSFVGSRQWIGSFEIALLMDHFYKMPCKIMHLGSGSEFPAKARELALHFETEGSPVMIGGGVLAYTLLGVHWDEATGDARFLILDPHYTGREDLDVVLAKGWCGWKKPNLFLANAFYNLCLPQRPKAI